MMNAHRLLIDEAPIVVSPSLVKIFGFERAVILQQIHFILNNPKSGKLLGDGHRYIWNTYENWAAEYSKLWSVSSLKRHFLLLEQDGVLVSCQPDKDKWDRTKYYRIDYSKLTEKIDELSGVNILENDSEIEENLDVKPVKQNDDKLDQRRDNTLDYRRDNMLDHRGDNALDHRTSNTLDHQKTETSSETSSETSKNLAVIPQGLKIFDSSEVAPILNLGFEERVEQLYILSQNENSVELIPDTFKVNYGSLSRKVKTKNNFEQRMLILSSYFSGILPSNIFVEKASIKKLRESIEVAGLTEAEIYGCAIWCVRKKLFDATDTFQGYSESLSTIHRMMGKFTRQMKENKLDFNPIKPFESSAERQENVYNNRDNEQITKNAADKFNQTSRTRFKPII